MIKTETNWRSHTHERGSCWLCGSIVANHLIFFKEGQNFYIKISIFDMFKLPQNTVLGKRIHGNRLGSAHRADISALRSSIFGNCKPGEKPEKENSCVSPTVRCILPKDIWLIGIDAAVTVIWRVLKSSDSPFVCVLHFNFETKWFSMAY